jgi:hypothetical protein
MLWGNQSPIHTPASEEKEKGGKEDEESGCARRNVARRAGAACEEEPDPRKPSTPMTPYFLDFHFTAPSLSASPTSVAAFLVTAQHTSSPTPSPPGPLGPLVSNAFPFHQWCLAVEPWTRASLVRCDQTKCFCATAVAAV